ncbi:MAG: DUF2029 domain-containing protein [Chlorobium sp.]|nr:MAG: DUF2029 domain-containing protein [Chlorobium sp.]
MPIYLAKYARMKGDDFRKYPLRQFLFICPEFVVISTILFLLYFPQHGTGNFQEKDIYQCKHDKTEDCTMNNQAGGNFTALSALLLAAFAVSFFMYHSINSIGNPIFAIDFSPYYVAGKLLDSGSTADLFPLSGAELITSSKAYLDHFQHFYFPRSPLATAWLYPAAYAWIFVPLSRMDYIIAARIWFAINSVLTCLAILFIVLARPWSGDPRFSGLRNAWIIFICLTFQPVFDNLWLGNISALVLFCFTMSYYFLKKGWKFPAGAVFGLIVPLKFTPALFIIYYVWRREWKVVAGMLAGAIAIVAASWVTTGPAGIQAYVTLVLMQLKSGGIAAFNNQSINGFLLHALTTGDVNGWEMVGSSQQVTLLRYLLVFILLAGVVRAMRRRPETMQDKGKGEDLDIVLLVCFMILASPISWYHYYMLFLLPLAVVFDELLLNSLNKGRFMTFAIAYGLLVTQGFSQIRTFAPQAIQDVRVLRIMLSASFFGAVIFTLLTIILREEAQ